jgi:hypothetical protein
MGLGVAVAVGTLSVAVTVTIAESDPTVRKEAAYHPKTINSKPVTNDK